VMSTWMISRRPSATDRPCFSMSSFCLLNGTRPGKDITSRTSSAPANKPEHQQRPKHSSTTQWCGSLTCRYRGRLDGLDTECAADHPGMLSQACKAAPATGYDTLHSCKGKSASEDSMIAAQDCLTAAVAQHLRFLMHEFCLVHLLNENLLRATTQTAQSSINALASPFLTRLMLMNALVVSSRTAVDLACSANPLQALRSAPDRDAALQGLRTHLWVSSPNPSAPPRPPPSSEGPCLST
jgi:hypothetical protein